MTVISVLLQIIAIAAGFYFFAEFINYIQYHKWRKK